MISFLLDVCFSWWEILTHLSWSLLEIEQEFNPLNSVDTPSETIAKLFYAVFLFIAVILLVNMLIALLSHTYQRVKVSDAENITCENSRRSSLPAPSAVGSEVERMFSRAGLIKARFYNLRFDVVSLKFISILRNISVE